MTCSVFLPGTSPTADRIIAWVDNNIERVGNLLASAFSVHGATVTTTDSAEGLLEQTKVKKFDHLLMDYDLAGENGFEKIAEICAEFEVGTVYICTAYAYLEEVDRYIAEYSEELGREIGLIRKEYLPFVDEEEEVENFLEKLSSGGFLGLEADSTVEKMLEKDLMPTFEQYKEMSLSQRIDVLKQGREKFRTSIDKHFDEGHVWILMDASNGRPVNVAKSTDEIWDHDEIDQFCEEKKLVLLSYSKGWSLDSLDGQCNPQPDLASYAVLALERLGNEVRSIDFVNYDDGNSFNLLAYEYFLEKGWFGAIKNPGMREQGDLTLVGKELKISDVEVKDSFGQTRTRTFGAFATMGWAKLRIALECKADCGSGVLYPPSHQEMICSRRMALLGRNLKADLEVALTTFPNSSKVRIENLPD